MFLLAFCLSGIFMMIELKRVSKYISWYLAIIPFTLLVAMMGFNQMNRDYDIYERAFYDEFFRSTFDYGYAILVTLIERIGGNQTSIFILMGVLLFSTLLINLKNNNYVNLVIFFYCLYPLIYDINQIRNTLMYFLIVLSLYFVEKRKLIRHYVLWLLSFSMHKLALLYLPFYYLCKRNRKQFMLIIIWTTFILAVISPIVINVIVKLYPLKMPFYLVKQPRLVVLSVFVYALFDFFTVWWIDKRISSRLKDEDKRKMEILYRFVWLPILILPFTFYTVEISRMQRNALLVKYIYCALAMKYLTIKERVFTVILLTLSITIYILMLVYNQDLDLYQYLEQNSIKYFIEKYIFLR